MTETIITTANVLTGVTAASLWLHSIDLKRLVGGLTR